MSKAITFTANLLAETTYRYATWKEGKTHRAAEESFQVGGKGINVSKMLNRLGAENVATCFSGGGFGPVCEDWLEANGIVFQAFREGCVTRSGSVIVAENREETTFLGCDSVVSEEAVSLCIDWLKAIEGEWILAICGSVQRWDADSWEPLRRFVQERSDSVRLVVDNYGPSLPWFLQQRPDFVKFNRDELETLFPEKERSFATEALLLKAQKRFGVDRWVVTNGAESVTVLDGEHPAVSFEPRKVECVSPTGCGDVFFATLIDQVYNGGEEDLVAAAKLAAEYASRSAASLGIADFEL